MKFRVIFRSLVIDDLNTQCPFLPAPYAFEMYLIAVAEDLRVLDGIADVSREGDTALVIEANADVPMLQTKLKPILQRYFNFLRYQDIAEL